MGKFSRQLDMEHILHILPKIKYTSHLFLIRHNGILVWLAYRKCPVHFETFVFCGEHRDRSAHAHTQTANIQYVPASLAIDLQLNSGHIFSPKAFRERNEKCTYAENLLETSRINNVSV